jgi:hypothetical protein
LLVETLSIEGDYLFAKGKPLIVAAGEG